MSDNQARFVLGGMVGFMLGILVWAPLFIWATETDLARSAIQHDAAHYDTKTGKLTWGKP